MGKSSTITDQPGVPRARRRWSLQEKQRIVEASLVPGSSIVPLARDNSVNANQVHWWRRLYSQGLLGGPAAAGSPPPLLPVHVITECEVAGAGLQQTPPAAPLNPKAALDTPPGIIEIETSRGRLRIEGVQTANASGIRAFGSAFSGAVPLCQRDQDLRSAFGTAWPVPGCFG